MPFIRLSVSQKLTPEKQQALTDGLGEAISIFPGKNGSMLVVEMEDGKPLCVGGIPQESFVFADVRYGSRFEYHIKKRFTQAVFKVFADVLGTPKDKAFLTISELSGAGGFGDFKDQYYAD